MDLPTGEASTGLKVYIFGFVVLLIGTLLFFIIRQNQNLTEIYAANDAAGMTVRHSVLLPASNVDSGAQIP